ncbi:hypothetical protein ACI2IY_05650 [Lysobacter enzymogenes]|uniref:hypothetical protein n=1 Tax=Lysobacter enzymogenes TaxID=69 RepID=UPI00384F2F68
MAINLLAGFNHINEQGEIGRKQADRDRLRTLAPKVFSGDAAASAEAYGIDPDTAKSYDKGADRVGLQVYNLATQIKKFRDAGRNDIAANIYNEFAKTSAAQMRFPNMPKQWDATTEGTLMPIVDEIIARTHGMDGGAGNLLKTYVDDQGNQVGVTRDGTTKVLGKAEEKLQVRDQEGLAPGVINLRDRTIQGLREVPGDGAAAPAAPAADPQASARPAASSASDLSSPITMPSGDFQDVFASIAARNGSVVTSGVRPVMPGVGAGAGSQHPAGTAADFRTNGLSDAQVQGLMDDLRAQGFEVIDERDNRNGLGPHIHAELPPGGRRAAGAPGAAASTSTAAGGLAAPRPAMSPAEEERLRLSQRADQRAEAAAQREAERANQGGIPAGYQRTADGNGLEPIPGGPADRKANPTPADQAKAEQSHRKELSDRLKEPRSVLTMYTNLEKAARNPSAANDLSLIFAYMKMLDPGSVVREQEFANAQNAAGVPDQIRNLFNKLRAGERLNDGQRASFMASARQLANTAQSQITAATREYQNIAEQYGWDPQRSTGMADFRDVGSAPARGAGGAPAQYRQNQVINMGGKRYRVIGGDPSDPELEEIP